MRQPNLQAIRRQLPHGAIKDIADNAGITARVVSEFFGYGWHQQHSAAILSAAADIIRDKLPSEEVMGEFEELGLTGHSSGVVSRKKRVVTESRGGNSTVGWLLGIAGIAVGAYFVVPEVKNFIDEKIFSKKKANLTPAEEQAAAVAAAKTK
ncbi:MAG: hypothetical protein ACOYBO_15160 [Azonexus sp.]